MPYFPRIKPRAAFVSLTIAATLAACGGGGNTPPSPVPVAAAIVTQPSGQTVNAGQAVTFTVTATGTGLSYQWQRDGVNVANATSSSYTLGSVQMTDDGSRWTVVVTSAGGAVTSTAAVLIVRPAAGLSLVAGGLGGVGNADGPVGRLTQPHAVAVDQAGVVYISQYDKIRTVTPGASAGADALVTTRYTINIWLNDMALDAAGNLIGVSGNRLVKMTPAGVAFTLAGAEEAGNLDGVGAAARFNQPGALAVGADGTIYVADKENRSVRVVSPAGVVTTHAAATAALKDGPVGTGGGSEAGQAPTSIALDGAGNLYIGGGPVRKVTPSGTASKLAFNVADAMAADKAGNLYAIGNCVLEKYSTDGKLTVLAGKRGETGSADGAGDQARFGGGFQTTCQGRLTIDSANNLYYADSINNTIRKITPDGVVSTIAGKAWSGGAKVDGVGAAARFDGGYQLSADAQGSVYLRQGNSVRKVTRTGMVTTLNLPEKVQTAFPVKYFPGGLAFNGMLVAFDNGVISQVDANGAFTALAGKAGAIAWVDGVGTQASFGDIMHVARDGQGNLYVVDILHGGSPIVSFDVSRVRKITPSGVVSTLYKEEFDPATPEFRPLRAKMVAVDKDGNLTVTDDYDPSRMINITADGKRTLFSVDNTRVNAIAMDKAGNLHWVSQNGSSSTIHKRTAGGVDTIVVGNINSAGVILGALPGSLGVVTGLTFDNDGVMYVMSENALLRVVP